MRGMVSNVVEFGPHSGPYVRSCGPLCGCDGYNHGMANYRRYFQPGGTYFFTVVTEGRAPLFHHQAARDILHDAFVQANKRWPFQMPACVLLPDHLHVLWTLPPGDDGYSTRWGWIKKEFTKEWLAAGKGERIVTPSQKKHRRRGVWQRKYWEHAVDDERDFQRHFDYIHYNPVKHGYVRSPKDWPWSTFQKWVKRGVYEPTWGTSKSMQFSFHDLDETAME